jgi:hypothetical protein
MVVGERVVRECEMRYNVSMVKRAECLMFEGRGSIEVGGCSLKSARDALREFKTGKRAGCKNWKFYSDSLLSEGYTVQKMILLEKHDNQKHPQ